MNIPHDWTFKNADVAAGFDKHVREQLPWYDLETGVIAHFARHYIPHGGLVYDIGASTGNVGRAIADVLAARTAGFIPIDSSKDMLDRYSGPGELVIADAEDFDFQPFDFAACFLVLMFIAPSKRSALIAKLRRNIKPGGALIVFDKCVPLRGYVGTVMSRLALAGKTAAGVDAREIIAKELSLAGVQRPIDPAELGRDAQEIFRFGDFAGWIIEAATGTRYDDPSRIF